MSYILERREYRAQLNQRNIHNLHFLCVKYNSSNSNSITLRCLVCNPVHRSLYEILCLEQGVYENGKNITVMRTYIQHDWRVDQFVNEIEYLMKLEHQNIVRLVGYAFEISKVLIKLSERKTVLAEEYKRAICLEYLPNGSLEKYLTGTLLFIPL